MPWKDDSKMTNLSHVVSYALRHNPFKYNLKLDNEGWTSVDKLLNALSLHRNSKLRYKLPLQIQDLEEMIVTSDKVRFELKDGKIRALYGHSYPHSSKPFAKIRKAASEPPSMLYHGTSPSAAKIIMLEGILPMNRQYVHLSTDRYLAIQVAKRKIDFKRKEQAAIFAISSLDAHQKGVKFYRATDSVWLADYISPDFLELME